MKPNIYWIPNHSAGKLAIVARPRGNDWLEEELTDLHDAGFDTLISLLTPEENIELGLEAENELSQQLGLVFIGYPVRDYGVPNSVEEAARVVGEIDNLLANGKTIGVHCRQSIGRSSLLIACILSMSEKSVDEIFRLIESSRGTRVPDTPEQKAWVRNFARTYSPQLSVG